MSIDRLFPYITEENAAELERFGNIIKKVWPLKAKHRDHLKYDIRDMSRGLTSERDKRRKDYMTDAKFLSPYICYFLPWNLYRMSRLFTGLELDIPDGAHIADIGSGPLTAVIALWMSRPHLRERKLNFTCMDLSPKSMQAGLALFKALAGDNSPWRIKTVKAMFTDRINKKCDLIIAANAFNELDWSGRTARPQAEKLTKHLISSTTESGRILLIETGVRLTGRIIAEMRAQMIEQGFTPLPRVRTQANAPCPPQAKARHGVTSISPQKTRPHGYRCFPPKPGWKKTAYPSTSSIFHAREPKVGARYAPFPNRFPCTAAKASMPVPTRD